MNIIAFIPAKTDSKRLPKKNLQLINGKTLIEHSIEYAMKSKHNVHIVVSTDDWNLLRLNSIYTNVEIDIRDQDLCGDTEVVDVYLDYVDKLDDDAPIDLFVALQPDHPDRQHTFDEVIDYFVQNNYDDLITIEENYRRSGSVRVFKYEHLVYGNVSKRIGTLVDTATDIHYLEDLEKARNKMNNEN